MNWPAKLNCHARERIRALILLAIGTFWCTDVSADSSVSLAWNSANNPDVAGYRIYFGTASHTYDNVMDVGNVTTAVVSVPGTNTYYFAATTYDTNNIESDFSNEAAYTVSGLTNKASPVNMPPTLNEIGNISIAENAGQRVVNFSGVSTGSGASVSITASSSNPSLIPNPVVNYTSPNSAGTVTFAPALNQYGTAIITVTVNNGQPANNLATQTFSVTVVPVNQPPTLDPFSNLTLNYNSSAQSINLTGISSGAENELQALTVKATSSNTRVIPTPTVNYSSPLSTGTLIIKPATGASGSVVITVSVNDGGKSNNIVTRTFNVMVKTQAASLPAPSLTTQPSSQVVLSGKSATFKVTASGSGTLKYQWKYNGTNISGATGASLAVKNCTAKQAGLYTVAVSNTGGSTGSTPASLVVASTPAANLVPAQSTNGQFAFNIVGVTGYKYAVQASTDMLHWTSVKTNTAPYFFTETDSNKPTQKFYRTVYVP